MNALLWAAILAAAGLAWTLIWSDATDRRRAIARNRGCACACPGLTGNHSQERCEF